MLQSTTQSFASTLLASGRSEAQHEELANLRTANQTYNNDIRLNNIRLAADGTSAEKMGLLQFASTLMSTAKPKQVEAEGVPAAAPFDAMAAMRAMSGMSGGPSTGPSPALLGYGGEEGAEQWAEKERARGKAKKRKKKEKREKQKSKKATKISNLVNDQGMSYEAAAAVITDVMDSDSSSSSSSS